jgi:sodium pump decarboxylase gamma subunit
MEDDKMQLLDGYTADEISYIIQNSFGFYADGNAIKGAVTSFNNAKDSVGEIVKVNEVKSKIEDKTIIVTVSVDGTIKKGNAEVILTNDMFMEMQSAALNEESTMGDAMTKAALNTIIGMGTVFIVLILISFIIALFGFIPKIQAKMAERKNKKEEIGIDNTISQIVEKEEVDVTDDYELVAVIAAAIAASEGAASTDGFVVRSVRKVNRRR